MGKTLWVRLPLFCRDPSMVEVGRGGGTMSQEGGAVLPSLLAKSFSSRVVMEARKAYPWTVTVALEPLLMK